MNTNLAGLPRILAFQLRRSWLRMLIWALILPVLVLVVNGYMTQTFPTQADRDAYAATANTPSLAALTGLFSAAASVGGILNIKLWMANVIALTLVTVFLVTRNGRAEEETGRAELLRQTAIGRHTVSVAGWLLAAGFALVTGLLCGLAGLAGGLPADGSMLMGLSYSGAAIAFIGIAAITGQVASTGRGATAWGAIVLAVAYLVRAVADVNGAGETPAWYTWLSPLGWAQQTRSFGENQWWVLVPCLALGVVGCGVAIALERVRDLGAGIVPARPGPHHAAAFTRTVVGLPLRLQRTAIISWTVGIAVAGVFFGAIAKLMNDLLVDLGSSPIGSALGAGADSQLDGLLGFFLVFLAVLVTAFAIQSTLALRLDETATGEVEWATAVSRWAWVGARLAIPAVASGLMLAIGGRLQGITYGAQVGDWKGTGDRFAAAALAYWPVIALVIATVALAVALLPRAAAGIAWALYGLIVLVAALGDVLGIPHDIVAKTPYWAVPQPGRTDPSWGPVWLMAAAAIVLAALALWRYRQRDQAQA